MFTQYLNTKLYACVYTIVRFTDRVSNIVSYTTLSRKSIDYIPICARVCGVFALERARFAKDEEGRNIVVRLRMAFG